MLTAVVSTFHSSVCAFWGFPCWDPPATNPLVEVLYDPLGANDCLAVANEGLVDQLVPS